MKSLYDKNYRYTPDAESLDSKASEALSPVFWFFVEHFGYSPREVAHIISGVVTELELEYVMKKPHEKVKP